MNKKNGPGGCCCCAKVYSGSGSVVEINFGKYTYPELDLYEQLPNDGTITIAGGARWYLDHYNERMWLPGRSSTGANSKIISWLAVPFQAAIADNTITDVLDVGSSFVLNTVCTASVEEEVFYGCRDATPSGNSYIYKVNFDGTGNTLIATITGSDTIGFIEHCRYNDKLYFTATKSAVSRRVVWRCDRDGSNLEEVYDCGGGSLQLVDYTGFCFDNLIGKLYVTQRRATISSYGQIVRMDLDGTNAATVYTTASYGVTNYTVRGVRFSNKQNKLYWAEGSTQTVSYGRPEEPTRNLNKADPDGSNVTEVKSAYQIVNETAFRTLDIGCGYETMGPTTLA